MGGQSVSSLVDAFLSHPDIVVKQGIPAAQCTTFAVGGPVEMLIEPQSFAGLAHALHLIQREAVEYRILGAGSNVLAPDAGLRGVTIRLGRGFRYVRGHGNGLFEVGGAMSLMSLSREVSDAGFAGLEFAGGIPASLGGAVRMNAGAHGAEMAGCLEAVTLLLPEQRTVRLTTPELGFSYRHSELPAGAIVLHAELRLSPSTRDRCAELRRKFLAERKAHQPLTLPSAGSVFKNPLPDRPAGLLLESAGMKGRTVGGAKVSELHANWIVNEERRATAADILELIKVCQEAVCSKFGVELVPEVIPWS